MIFVIAYRLGRYSGVFTNFNEMRINGDFFRASCKTDKPVWNIGKTKVKSFTAKGIKISQDLSLVSVGRKGFLDLIFQANFYFAGFKVIKP